MSDDNLERRLRALDPAKVPAELQCMLLAVASPVPVRIHWLRFALPLSAAAVIALGFFLRGERPAAPPPAKIAVAPGKLLPSDLRVFLPIEQTSTLVEVRDVAVVDRDSLRPVRLVRATWLDDITYAGDDGRSKLRRQQPRSEIIPVALETF